MDYTVSYYSEEQVEVADVFSYGTYFWSHKKGSKKADVLFRNRKPKSFTLTLRSNATLEVWLSVFRHVNFSTSIILAVLVLAWSSLMSQPS